MWFLITAFTRFFKNTALPQCYPCIWRYNVLTYRHMHLGLSSHAGILEFQAITVRYRMIKVLVLRPSIKHHWAIPKSTIKIMLQSYCTANNLQRIAQLQRCFHVVHCYFVQEEWIKPSKYFLTLLHNLLEHISLLNPSCNSRAWSSTTFLYLYI